MTLRRAGSASLRHAVAMAALIAAFAAASIPVHAAADEPAARPQARIVVVGTGQISAAPDYADIGCGVTGKAKTAREATETNSKTMKAVQAALRDAGIDQKDIQTQRFSLQPVYTPAQPNVELKLTGFSVSNQFRVTIRQIDKVGDILDRLIAAGATDIGNVSFQHADPSKLLDQAREAAIADARRQAEIYAHAAGVDLGSVVFISDEPGGRPSLFAQQAAMRAAAAPVPVSVGEDMLTAQVTVGFDFAR